MRYILFLSIVFISFQLEAQNIVQNGGFEELQPNMYGDTICPGGAGQIVLAKYWNKSYGSVDYFNSCSNDTYRLYGTPSNRYGFQHPRSNSNAYAALVTYTEGFDDYREYLWHELSEPLDANARYRLTFYVSLADSSNISSDKIGAYFSQTSTRGLAKEEFFEFDPQVVSDSDDLANKEGWTPISYEFTAEGEEKFLTIGSFWLDSETDTQRIGNSTFIWDSSIYYLDDVSLEKVSGVGVDEITSSIIGLQVYPNPATDVLNVDVSARSSVDMTVRVFDMVGREILTSSHPSLQGGERLRLDVSGWAEGVYSLVLVVNGNAILSKKLAVLKD